MDEFMLKVNGGVVNGIEMLEEESVQLNRKLITEDLKMLNRKRLQADISGKKSFATPNQSQFKESTSFKNSILRSVSGIKATSSYYEKLDKIAIFGVPTKNITSSRFSAQCQSRIAYQLPIRQDTRGQTDFCKEHFKLNSAIKLGVGCIAAFSLLYYMNADDSYRLSSENFISDRMLIGFGAILVCVAAIKYKDHLKKYNLQCSELALQISNEIIERLIKQIEESGQIYLNEDSIIEIYAEKYNFNVTDFRSEIYHHLNGHLICNPKINKIQLEQDEATSTYWVYKSEETKL